MNPSRNPRPYTRITQACSNCRRKKTRCPGERPACSHCVRLSQDCFYPDSRIASARARHCSSLEERITQLEERLSITEASKGVGTQGEALQAIAADISSPTSSVRTTTSGLVPSEATIIRAIDTYYEHVHRQPLWLFNRHKSFSPQFSEELILIIMGMALLHPSGVQSSHDPRAYCDAARKIIMTRIESANVDVSVMQALCLLAYLNILMNDSGLASFHTALVKTLIQGSCLGQHSSEQRTTHAEENSRLIWSVHLLDCICGQQQRSPSFVGNIRSTSHPAPTSMGTSTADPCVPLPHEQSGSSGESSVGIWAHMVNITGLWSEVRCYISECAEGRTKLPWMPESRYSSINSQILEFERTFPDVHRYESANFSGQLVAKVFAEREYWLPWLRVQISYHCVSCILNHPFLLSSAKPKSITGTNAFWKSSSQLALLHGTWISRILQLAKNKNLELNDPYFTYAAVVAATLHTYWSRATDEAVQASARKHLDTCQTFVADWGPRWPVSEFLVPLLNKFVNLMLNQDFVQHDRREVARAKVSLVWSLFDFALYRPDPRNRGLFSPSFAEHQALQLAVQQANFTVDDPDVETRPDHVYRMVDGCAVSAAYQNRPYSAESPRGSLQPQQDAESSNDGIAGVTSQFDWEWASGLAQYYHDPSARPHEQSDVNLDWWEVGNL